MIVTVKDAGQFGVVADQAGWELPPNAWTRASNIRFRDGYAERFLGESAIFTTPTVTPYYVQPFTTPGKRWWVHAGTDKVFVDDGATQTDITPASDFTGAIDDRWTGCNLSGILVLNNGVEVPQYWDGNTSNNLADLTGWDANWTCKAMRSFKQFLVAMNVTKSSTNYPHMVKWSDAALPGALPASWDETDAATRAGERDLAETPDNLIDGLQLGDTFVLYKETSMFGMQFVGGDQVFRTYRMPGDVGLMARGCVAQFPGGHVMLTPGDVVVHSGQGVRSILTSRMRRWLFNSIDATYYQRAFVVTQPRLNEAWICFPETSQETCTVALVWNWQDDTLGIRRLNSVTYGANGLIDAAVTLTFDALNTTWDSYVGTWDANPFNPSDPRLVLARTAPQLVLTEGSISLSGTAMDAVLERTGLHFDAPDKVKTVKAVYPRVDAPTGTVLSIEVGATMDPEQGTVWTAPVTYTVGSTYKADTFATGRFLALRISSSGGRPWRIRSYDMDIHVRGTY